MRLAQLLALLPQPLRRKFERLATKGELPPPFTRSGAIFVHIPKAAGSSVSQALFGCQVGHIAISELYQLNRAATRRCFKFAFVREPLDRLHSAFEFLQRGGINANDQQFSQTFLRDLDFDAFVERLEVEPAIQRWWHFRTQQSFLCHPADSSQIGVNFIGRYETLERDFSAICGCLGIDVALPRANPTRGRTSVSSIDAATAERVRRIYACDYELLGYD